VAAPFLAKVEPNIVNVVYLVELCEYFVIIFFFCGMPFENSQLKAALIQVLYTNWKKNVCEVLTFMK